MECEAIRCINQGIQVYSKRAESLSRSAARFAVISTLITIALGFTAAALVVLSSIAITSTNAGELAASILALQLVNAFFISLKTAIDPSKKAAVFQQCAKEYNNIKRDLIVTRDEWKLSGEDSTEINRKYIELARELNKTEDKIYADQPLQIFADRAEIDLEKIDARSIHLR